MKTHTFRGKLNASEQRRLIIDDGRFQHGMKIRELYLFPVEDGGTQLTTVTLATQYDSSAGMDAEDNRQIGWGVVGYSTSGGTQVQALTVVDPDRVIVRDLYVRNNNVNDPVNFLIVMEAITMTDEQAILQLIKERSQDDLR